jgi:hypothetical protein
MRTHEVGRTVICANRRNLRFNEPYWTLPGTA